MAQITIEIDDNVQAKKLDGLIRYFGGKDTMFNKFIEFHLRKTQREIVRIQSDLDAFEKKYGMDSASFYKSFDSGDLKDSKDYILWSGIYEMQLASKKRLSELS